MKYKNNSGGYVQRIDYDHAKTTGIIKLQINRNGKSIDNIIGAFNKHAAEAITNLVDTLSDAFEASSIGERTVAKTTLDGLAGSLVAADHSDGHGAEIKFIGSLENVMNVLNKMEGAVGPAVAGQSQWSRITEIDPIAR